MTEEQATEIIGAIEAIKLQDEDAYSRIETLLKTKLASFGTFAFDLSYHPDLYYCRARIMDNVDDYFDTISDHSYNPYPEYIEIGRANKAHQQIFYLGRTRPTSLAEVNIIENQKESTIVSYGISRWQPIKPLKIVALVDLESMDRLEADEIKDFVKFVKGQIPSLSEGKNRGYLTFYKYIGKRFRELITKEERYKYKFTCAFSNMIYDSNPDINGIMYQSVKLPEFYNLAIRKEMVDEYYFKPTHFVKNKFERENVVELTEIQRHESHKFDERENKIVWEGLPVTIDKK